MKIRKTEKQGLRMQGREFAIKAAKAALKKKAEDLVVVGLGVTSVGAKR